LPDEKAPREVGLAVIQGDERVRFSQKSSWQFFPSSIETGVVDDGSVIEPVTAGSLSIAWLGTAKVDDCVTSTTTAVEASPNLSLLGILVFMTTSLLDCAVLHARRIKNGTPSTHPIQGDELRALRRLQRESPTSPCVFMSEPGFTTAGFACPRAGAPHPSS
jgi:hypothetical protein